MGESYKPEDVRESELLLHDLKCLVNSLWTDVVEIVRKSTMYDI